MAMGVRLARVAPEAGQRDSRAGDADDVDLLEVRSQPVGECLGNGKRVVVGEDDVGAAGAGDTAVVAFGQRLRVVDDDQVESFIGEGDTVESNALFEASAIDTADDDGKARQGRTLAGAAHRWISSILYPSGS